MDKAHQSQQTNLQTVRQVSETQAWAYENHVLEHASSFISSFAYLPFDHIWASFLLYNQSTSPPGCTMVICSSGIWTFKIGLVSLDAVTKSFLGSSLLLMSPSPSSISQPCDFLCAPHQSAYAWLSCDSSYCFLAISLWVCCGYRLYTKCYICG